MVKGRHPNKSKGWIIQHYFQATGRPYGLSAQERESAGHLKVYRLVLLKGLSIGHHVKIEVKANSYLLEYAGYFWHQQHRKEARSQSAKDRQIIQAIGKNWAREPMKLSRRNV